ncbi:MAG: DUF2023 family protein [Gammaproteobacteria bacterium]|nr:MAG: DUF2023 family protein [Gammaproteobacteria bacterium]
MRVFCHHIYEFRKGLRNLVLYTGAESEKSMIEKKLKHYGIAYMIQPLTNGRINVYFGNNSCVQVIRSFGKKLMKNFTPEEDFILGTMLGYDRLLQCDRYLQRKEKTACKSAA